MLLDDLSREDWEALMRALSQQEYQDRQLAAMKDGARRTEITGWADRDKRLHDQFLEEFRARCFSGRMPPYRHR